MSEELTKQGVRNLNNWKPAKPNERKVEKPVPQDIEILSDLIYSDTERIREDISGRFPEATFEAEWDEIHGDRLSVRGIRASRLTYYKFLITHKIASLSLMFGVAMYQDQATVEKALDDVEPLWRSRVKKLKASEEELEG